MDDIQIQLPPHQVVPYRICLEVNGNYYAAVDLQIKSEPPHGSPKLSNPDSASVYLNSPIIANYKLLDQDAYNPHLSWHGSGNIHAKASIPQTSKTKLVGGPIDAIAYTDMKLGYFRILSACIPVYTPNLMRVSLSPKNTLNAYSTPKSGNASPDIQSIVIDVSALENSSAVIVDVFVHHRATQFNWDAILALYADGVVTPAYPMTFHSIESIFAPAVTVLVHNANGLPIGYHDFSLMLLGTFDENKFYVKSRLVNADIIPKTT